MVGDVRIRAGEVPQRVPHWAVSATTVPEEEHVAVLRDMRERGVRFVTGDGGNQNRPASHVNSTVRR